MQTAPGPLHVQEKSKIHIDMKKINDKILLVNKRITERNKGEDIVDR